MLLRLSAPMQSWGTQSHFTRRDTGLEPSKSGVIGLLCAALGRARDEPVADLAALQMGVRVDREGIVQMDYHTVGGGAPRGSASRESAAGTAYAAYAAYAAYGVAEFSGGKRTVVSRRAYLADANFLVGLAASTPDEERLLQLLDEALAHPVWPLFLGRKSFPPAEPVRLPDAPPLGPGLRPLALQEALLQYPWPAASSAVMALAGASSEMASSEMASGALSGAASQPQALRFVFEDPSALSGELRQDTPVSFTPLDRRYAPRFVRTEFHTRPETTPVRAEPE